MPNHSSEYFLLAALAITAILTYIIFSPFLSAIILAIVFAVVLHPLYRHLLPLTKSPALASLSVIVLVIIFLLLPLTFIGSQLFNEAAQISTSLVENGGTTGILADLQAFESSVRSIVPIPAEFQIDVNQYARAALTWIASHLGDIFSNIARVLVGLFIFLIALYYTLKEGARLRALAVTHSPLRDKDDEHILDTLHTAINSVVRGNLLIALIQGVLTAVGFLIFGVPNAALWGTIAAVAALIPGIGTALVLTPAITYLFFVSSLASAVGLLVWGVLAVGLIDNFLGPTLVGRGMNLHPLLILLSVLGGIAYFGPIGFILGPLTVTLLVALLGVYFRGAKAVISHSN